MGILSSCLSMGILSSCLSIGILSSYKSIHGNFKQLSIHGNFKQDLVARFNFNSIQNDDLEIAVDRKNCHKGDALPDANSQQIKEEMLEAGNLSSGS